MSNVYYVEGINQNLLSFSRITKNATITARDSNAKIYNKSGELVAVANKIDNLYSLKSYALTNASKDKYVYSVRLSDKEKWLEHLSM